MEAMELEREYLSLKNQGVETPEVAKEVALKLGRWGMDVDLRSRLFGTLGGGEADAVYQRMQPEIIRLNLELKWLREFLAPEFGLDLQQIYDQLQGV